ncbi:hypothetical protein OAG75_01135 [bacterium]|nr:hypothetical protein [bacterium]
MSTALETNFVTNMKAAAEALEISLEEFEELKKTDGFPQRTSQGWNIVEIMNWLNADQSGDVGPEEIAETEETKNAAQSEADSETRVITIEIPVCAPDPNSYIAKQRGHIDVKLNRQSQLPAFREIHAGLRAVNTTFTNGKPVESAADVVRYLAVLIARELECEDGEQ